jgi:predicted transcriptional regulator of viral defense system
MGQMKMTDKIKEYARRTQVFDTKSVIRLVGNENYAYLLLNHLVKRGEIKRLTKGYYTIHDDPSLIVYCLKPAYLGLQDAMSLHDLWNQETVPVVLTTRRIRPGVRKVMGNNVIIRRISAKHFFGYDHFRKGELMLPVSDIEKTFIDMAYFGYTERERLRGFTGRMDIKKLMGYLKKYDKKFASKVIGLI